MKYYVTTAIDYPNAPPHIGHAYEKIIADLLARWHAINGEEVFFLTGLDEHGQKIEKAAKEAGKEPQQFVDDMSVHYRKLCEKLNLSLNRFIRTTDEDHTEVCKQIVKAVKDKNLIYKDKYKGPYCVGCEAFYLDRELDEGKCPIHKKPVEELSEESYFFKMSEFQDKLVEHINNNPEFIQPETRRNEILSRLKEPLRDLSVSRTNFKWGIPFPDDETHIIYVWFDALLNYISGIDYPSETYEKFWPVDCQQIGKDVIWFHTVIWPTILMAAELPLPKTVYSHGWLTVDGHKMSKSLGNVVDPIKIVDEYGADRLRYFLLREVPAGEDGDFSEKALIERTNADLADSLGNLLQRTSVMIHKNFEGKIPKCGTLTDVEKELNKKIPTKEELNELMNNYKWHKCLERIWDYIHLCNKYVNDSEPWKQKDKDRLGTILYTLVEHLRIIGTLVWPVIPEAAERLLSQIGQERGTLNDITFKENTAGKISEPKILFDKLEAKQEDPFSILHLKVAEIKSVEQHPNADKLYVIKIDAGEKRQLVAGMKQFYTPEELIGKKVVVLTNLKPAKLRGIESQGMLLAAEKGETVKVLEVQGEPGDEVVVAGITPKTKQITIEDFMKIKLTTKDSKVVYDGKELSTSSGHVKVDIEDGAEIR